MRTAIKITHWLGPFFIGLIIGGAIFKNTATWVSGLILLSLDIIIGITLQYFLDKPSYHDDFNKFIIEERNAIMRDNLEQAKQDMGDEGIEGDRLMKEDYGEIANGSYILDKNIMAKYTKMFRQPFNQVVSTEKFIIHDYECILYRFSPRYVLGIGDFCFMIEVKGNTTRYFASEYSFNRTYVLCEWVFKNEKEVAHINYGDVVSRIEDLLIHTEIVKERLEKILDES